MKVAVVALALLAAPALAADKEKDKEKIAVVDLDAPAGMLGLSTQVIKAILTEAAKTKRPVISPDELRDKLGNKQMNELSKCADRPACAADKLSVMGATKAILGKLNRDEKNYVLQLWFLDLNGLNVITEVDRSILIASRRFQGDVEKAIPGFLRGEREAHGTVTITATTQNAQVSINGEFMGVAPITTSLKPGKYEVRVEKPKFLPVKRYVNVEANQKTTEEFRMLLMPGEKEDELAPLTANKKPEEEKGGSFSISAPTIAAGAVTLVAFGTALGFGFVSKSQYDDLKKGYNEATDTYSGTREQALAAQRNAIAANVCFGIAGAALIATIVLAVLDARSPSEPEPALDVAPAAAPGGGAGVIIGGRF